MPTLVTMPKWGLTMQSGTVTGWIAGEGEMVAAGAPLLTVETEKAVNDIEAPADGVLARIVANAGEEVPVSGPVAVILAPGETASDEEIAALLGSAAVAPATSGATAGALGETARTAQPATRDAAGRVNASPAARKLAGELGVDLAAVPATGPGGRITSDDVEKVAAGLKAGAAQPREERVELPLGMTLQALVAGPADAKVTLVFLHGLGGSLSTWSQLMGEFVDKARLVALDLPGHGRSDKPDSGAFDYSVAGLAGAVGEAVTQLGAAPAVLIGHSLGGAVAMQLAHDRPKLVRGLVLVNSAGLGREIGGELLDRVEAEPSLEEARAMLDLFFEDQRLILDRGVEEMYQTRISPGADAAMKAAASAAFSREGQMLDLSEKLGQIAVPTLVVWGEFDRVVPVGHAAAAATKIPGSWLQTVRGVGHVPQVEAPGEVTAVMRRWLKRLPTA
jgi:pyruvate dehydrogenase E2 component (dihydrolipoamide acetyltransferase)